MSTASYPKNTWYVAGWDYELQRGKMTTRRICGKPVIMFRTQDDTPVALEDACWHRLLPLSKGKLEGDNLVCGYHGLVFEPGGRCIHMPSQETINPSACVTSYPLVEKHRFVWIWMGDPALADPAKIPDLHWNKDPEWVGDGGVIEVKANYRLAIDNLMDLTHETFVHPTSIGNDAVAEAPFDVSHAGEYVSISRWMENIEPPAFWAAQLGKPGLVDRWQEICFTAPSTVALDVGVAVAGTGAPLGDRSQGVNGFVLHTFTPIDDSSCYYFWSVCRNYDLDNVRLTLEWQRAVRGIFAEDEAILEAQQVALQENPDKVFYNLNIDAGGVWARRAIDRMLSTEEGEIVRIISENSAEPV